MKFQNKQTVYFVLTTNGEKLAKKIQTYKRRVMRGTIKCLDCCLAGIQSRYIIEAEDGVEYPIWDDQIAPTLAEAENIARTEDKADMFYLKVLVEAANNVIAQYYDNINSFTH